MKPLHDYRCNRCDDTFEYREYVGAVGVICPACGHAGCTVVFLTAPAVRGRVKDPYEALDRVIPDSKPIKSYASDKRKGGKDTT